MDSLSIQPSSSAPPGPCTTGLPELPQTPIPQAGMISAGPALFRLPRLEIHRHCTISARTAPLRPAKLVINRHTQSLLSCASQSCQARDPQSCTISPGLCPSGLHRPTQSLPGSASQACRGPHHPHWAVLLRSAKTGPHLSRWPGQQSMGPHDLCKAMSLRHVMLVLHRPLRSLLGPVL
jgi:hypothetical protein